MTVGLDDIVRTTCNFTLHDGSQYQNVWHHQRIGSSGFTNAQHTAALESHFDALYDGISDRVKVGMVAGLSSVDKVEFVTGKWLVTENIGTFTLSFTGSGVGTVQANQISPYILYKTERPKTVGRKFMMPFLIADYVGSVVQAGLVAELVTFATASLVDVYLGAIDDLEVGVPRTGVNAWYPFNVAIVTNICGTQRRRRPGVGA